MSRENKYVTEIRFRAQKAKAFSHSFKSEYIFSKTFEDKIEISRGFARIDAERNGAVDIGDIFTNYNSAIYKQIIRSICLYYVYANSPDAISAITVRRSLHGVERDRVSLAKQDLGKIVDGSANFSLLSGLKLSEIAVILKEGPKGNAVLYALTHLIRSTATQSEHDRFEKLWRAFNALYKIQTKLTRDHDCHRALRTYIQANPSYFPNAIASVNGLDAGDIRGNIQWNKMILNYFPTQAHAGAFKDFVLRNSDSRLMTIFENSMSLRSAHLSSIGQLGAVLAHVQGNLAAGVHRDQDVLTMLSFKYMYFVRNRLAHAERTDAGFTLVERSRENQELAWLSKVLASLVVDLINLNSKY